MDIRDLKECFDRYGNATAQGFEKLKGELDHIRGDVEQMNERFVDLDMPTMTRSGRRVSPEQAEHTRAFEAWLRQPHSQNARAELETLQQKAVTIGTDGAGGYAVPEQLAQQILQRLRDLSPIRQIARVMPVSSSDFKEIVDVGGISSGWVGEGDTRTETDTPSIEEVAPTFGTCFAYPKASEESLADIMFDVQSWLVDRASEELAIQEGAAFISGNGTKKPTGFLNGAPSSNDDSGSPERAFGTLKYLATGDANGFGSLSTTSPEHYPADVLWQTVYDLRAGYRMNARWVMNSATAGVIRRFKDADGRYLWQDSLQAGQPALLCGYPVTIAEDMPDIGSNAFPVAFGDFDRGYLVADSFSVRVTVDSNITTPGQIKFYVRKRVGGKIRDDHAIRLVKCATS